MPNSDIYEANSGLFSVASTGGTVPVYYVMTPSTKRSWIVGVRISVGVTAAAAGNDILFGLARSTVGSAGGNAVTLVPNDSAAPAALTTSFVGSFSNAPAPATTGQFLWQQMLPQTTGSAWEEFPPLGYEWVIPAGGTVACFVVPSVNTSTPVQFQLIISE